MSKQQTDKGTTMADRKEMAVREKKELAAKEEKTVPGRYYIPYADIYETDEALAVVMEMPGVEKKGLGLGLENDVLRVDTEEFAVASIRNGRPLTDRMAVVELIAATTTKAGLKIESALDTRAYEKGIKVSDAQMKALDIQGDPFHPEWNYTIRPRAVANRSGQSGGCPRSSTRSSRRSCATSWSQTTSTTSA